VVHFKILTMKSDWFKGLYFKMLNIC